MINKTTIPADWPTSYKWPKLDSISTYRVRRSFKNSSCKLNKLHLNSKTQRILRYSKPKYTSCLCNYTSV